MPVERRRNIQEVTIFILTLIENLFSSRWVNGWSTGLGGDGDGDGGGVGLALIDHVSKSTMEENR